MINTLSGFKSYKYTQTTDGTNDYYVGIDGTNSFSITPFAGLADITFNILINFPSQVDSTDAQARLLEIANSARTSLFGVDVGAYSGLLTNEYIGLFTNIAGAVKTSGVVTATSISAGWHMITVSMAATAIVLCVDGVLRSVTAGSTGAPVNITSGFTANRLSLMATTAGGVPYGCTWREAMLLNTGWAEANALIMYNYYTRDGNVPLGNSNRSAWRYMVTPAARAQILELWKGNESGTDLLPSKNASSGKLTKTNF